MRNKSSAVPKIKPLSMRRTTDAQAHRLLQSQRLERYQREWQHLHHHPPQRHQQFCRGNLHHHRQQCLQRSLQRLCNWISFCLHHNLHHKRSLRAHLRSSLLGCHHQKQLQLHTCQWRMGLGHLLQGTDFLPGFCPSTLQNHLLGVMRSSPSIPLRQATSKFKPVNQLRSMSTTHRAGVTAGALPALINALAGCPVGCFHQQGWMHHRQRQCQEHLHQQCPAYHPQQQ